MIVGFDIDFRKGNLNEIDWDVLRSNQIRRNIEEQCPSENIWHFSCLTDDGRQFANAIANDYECVILIRS